MHVIKQLMGLQLLHQIPAAPTDTTHTSTNTACLPWAQEGPNREHDPPPKVPHGCNCRAEHKLHQTNCILTSFHCLTYSPMCIQKHMLKRGESITSCMGTSRVPEGKVFLTSFPFPLILSLYFYCCPKNFTLMHSFWNSAASFLHQQCLKWK